MIVLHKKREETNIVKRYNLETLLEQKSELQTKKDNLNKSSSANCGSEEENVG